MAKILVSPSILNVNRANLQAECASLQNCGADWIHCDVMDGVFVPNVSLTPELVADIHRFVNIPLDVHLMTVHPEAQIPEYVRAGAHVITFHLEAASDIAATAKLIKQLGAKVGLSIKPATPVEAIAPYAELLDMILVMSVEPGFGGQKFIPATLEKIRLARQLYTNKLIQVDGGINAETSKSAVEAGADVLVAGGYILNSQNRAESIAKLKNM